MAVKLKPGEEVKIAGQYIVVDSEGKRVPDTPEYTLATGDMTPPTPGKGMAFVLVDASARADSQARRRGFGEKPRAVQVRRVASPKRRLVPEAGEK